MPAGVAVAAGNGNPKSRGIAISGIRIFPTYDRAAVVVACGPGQRDGPIAGSRRRNRGAAGGDGCCALAVDSGVNSVASSARTPSAAHKVTRRRARKCPPDVVGRTPIELIAEKTRFVIIDTLLPHERHTILFGKKFTSAFGPPDRGNSASGDWVKGGLRVVTPECRRRLLGEPEQRWRAGLRRGASLIWWGQMLPPPPNLHVEGRDG